jgi:hypothetical protein
VHFDIKDREEVERREASTTDVRQGWTDTLAVIKTHELSEYQVAEEYLIGKVREVKMDIR